MAPSPTPWQESVREVVARCPRELTADECYRLLDARGVEYGPEFRGLTRLRLGEREAVGELYCPGAATSPYRVPPQLLDSALQALMVLAFSGPVSSGGPLVAAAIGSIRIAGRPTERDTCHATLLEERADGTRLGRAQLYDAAGAEVLRVDGLVLRPADSVPGARGWARERVYRVQWEERPATFPAATAAGEPPWLWLAGEEGTARAVAGALRARGRKDLVVAWPPGGAPRAISDPTFAVPAPEVGWETVLDSAGVERSVWLTSALSPEEVSLECERVLALCRGAARSRSTRLLVTTFGAHAEEVDPPQAALWGLFRVFAREHPDRWGGLVDVPRELRADVARVVETVLGAPDAEVAVRGGRVLEPRLRRGSLPPPSSGEHFRADASYLVTGGLGGVGLALAGWLVDRGASRLLLMARHPPSPLASEAIAALERRGAVVRVVTGDVARAEDAARAVAEPTALGWPPLRGVFHLAVSLADGVVQALDGEKVRTVLAAKVDGGWNLHRATAALDLDHFVLFSSIAVLGTPGQAAYAAGNAYLDALAARRRADGLPALSVGFGAFAEVGAAARLEARGVRSVAGVESMPPKRALDALGALLASPEPHALLAGVSWPTFSSGLPPGAGRLYSALVEPTGEKDAAGERAFSTRLRAQPLRARREALEAHLGGLVAGVLGLAPSQAPAPNQPLMNVGLDSLMMVQFRNAIRSSLDLDIPVTLLFDYPAIRGLAQYLAERLAPPPAGPGEETPPAIPQDELKEMLEELEQLPEEEVARRLRDDESGA